MFSFVMGFFVFDYLKCDPAEFNFRILALNGFWPLETDKNWLKKLHVVYSYICNFSITAVMFNQLLDLYLFIENRDLLALVKVLSMTSITIMTVCRHYLLIYKMEDIMALHKRLENLEKSLMNSSVAQLVKETNKKIAWTTKVYGWMVIVCVIVWTLAPLLDGGKKKEMMFPVRLPVNKKSTPVYEILYTYQALSMIGFMNNVIFTDLTFFSFIMRLDNLYDVLLKNISNIGRENDSNNQFCSAETGKENDGREMEVVLIEDSNGGENDIFKKHLRKCLEFHQYIFREIKVLQKIYAYPFLVVFTTITVMLGVILIDIVMISRNFKLQKYYKLWYSLCAVYDAFMWCYFADLLLEKGEKIGTAFYQVPWHKFHMKLRKDFLLPITKSRVVPQLKIANSFALSLSTFLLVMKLTYNLTLLLYQVMRQ